MLVAECVAGPGAWDEAAKPGAPTTSPATPSDAPTTANNSRRDVTPVTLSRRRGGNRRNQAK